MFQQCRSIASTSVAKRIFIEQVQRCPIHPPQFNDAAATVFENTRVFARRLWNPAFTVLSRAIALR